MSEQSIVPTRPTCEVCRDLNADHFERQQSFDVFLRTRGVAASQNLEYAELRESASMGCKICQTLHQGIIYFWGNDPAGLEEEQLSENEREKLLEDGATSNDKNLSKDEEEGLLGNEEVSSAEEASSDENIRASGRNSEDKSRTDNKCNAKDGWRQLINLKIIPEKGLLVGLVQVRDTMQRYGTRELLEFFTRLGTQKYARRLSLLSY